MKQKNKKFAVIVVILTIFSLFFLSNICYADTDTNTKMPSAGEMIQKGQNWPPKPTSGGISVSQITSALKPIIDILLAIGSVTIIVVTIIMGIKYVTATPDKQAQLKTQLIGLGISAVVLYGAYGIWSFVYNILKDVIGGTM